ncbi:MAG: carboxymuconolactone decarboxylase family protein [Deltaproteobacteria bacterium]|nr:carboxymuconolactone decarboxylase family protein [Deltaproteobacteria bacterium]
MSDDIVRKTKETAALYFKDVPCDRPFELWSSFDKGFAKDLSLFVTGQVYARQVVPHTVRQLVTTAALTVLEKADELELHLHAALNVGCQPRELAEVMFQTAVYGGVPAMNGGLKVLRKVLEARGLWPIPEAGS